MPKLTEMTILLSSKMPKRFTDTEKWKDEWYLSLTNDNRIVWQYLLDNCSTAGVLKKNYKLLNFCCNTNLTEKELLEIFAERVFIYEKFIFIPKFIKFQYPKGIKSDKPIIVGVRNELLDKQLIDSNFEIINQSLTNDRPIIMDKEKEKRKEKEKEITMPFGEIFKSQWLIWKQYKLKEHKFGYKSPESEQSAINELIKLANGDEDISIKIITQSLSNGWKGFFELKQNGQNTNSEQRLGDKIRAKYTR